MLTKPITKKVKEEPTREPSNDPLVPYNWGDKQM